jgi:hypothetical protein
MEHHDCTKRAHFCHVSAFAQAERVDGAQHVDINNARASALVVWVRAQKRRVRLEGESEHNDTGSPSTILDDYAKSPGEKGVQLTGKPVCCQAAQVSRGGRGCNQQPK